jgi:hypothetical protein
MKALGAVPIMLTVSSRLLPHVSETQVEPWYIGGISLLRFWRKLPQSALCSAARTEPSREHTLQEVTIE